MASAPAGTAQKETPRVLVIGLGSTGCDICDGLIERIESIYDIGTSGVPWLKLLALETADQDESKATARSRDYLQLDVPPGRVDQAKTNPQILDPSNDFSRWSDPKIISSWQPGPGAGNCRMIGRARLLHPDVLPRVVDQVITRLRDLQTLPTDFTDHEEKHRRLSEKIRIFICGTLVGGTGSGGLIDLGYILKSLPDFRGQIEVFGIIAVPGSNLSNNILKSNAFQALTELAHFSFPGARYKQKVPLPQFPQGMVSMAPGSEPFDNVFLVQPRSGLSSQQLEILIASVVEFLSVTCLTEGLSLAQEKLINPATIYKNMFDMVGRPQNFSSFGVSVIEYPIEQIGKGCASKLAWESLKEWLAQGDFDEQVSQNQFVNRLGLTANRLVDDLTFTGDGGVSFEQTLNSLLRQAIEAAASSGPVSLAQFEDSVEIGFDPKRTDQGQIRAGMFVSMLVERASKVRDDRLELVRSLIREIIQDGKRGSLWLSGTIKSWQARLARERSELDAIVNPEMLHALREEMDDQRIRLQNAFDSSLLAGLFWKGIAIDRILDQYEDASRQYWGHRVRSACSASISSLYKQVEVLLQKTEQRLTDPNFGLHQWIQELSHQMEKQYLNARNIPPLLNGFCDFAAGEDKTVDQEYAAILNEAKRPNRPDLPPNLDGQTYQKLAFLQDWVITLPGDVTANFLSESLLSDKPTRFDRVAQGEQGSKLSPTRSDLLAVTGIGRRVFMPDLRTRNIAERVTRLNLRNEVTNSAVSASPFIRLNDNATSNGLPGLGDPRVPDFVFINGGKDAAGGPEQIVRDMLNLHGSEVVDNETPHRVVIVRCRASFSAHAAEDIANFEPFWREELSKGWNPISRKDIEWRKMDGSEPIPRYAHKMSAVLIAIGLGIVRRLGTYYVEAPAAMLGMPPRRVEFEGSIDEAAILIEREKLAAWLAEEILKVVEREGEHSVATKLNDFATVFNSVDSPLTWMGQKLFNNDPSSLAGLHVVKRMQKYASTIPGLWEAWTRLVNVPPQVGYTEISGALGGYKCSFCGAFLADKDHKFELEKIVHCPNPICQMALQHT